MDLDFHIVFTRKLISMFLLEKTYIIVVFIFLNTMNKKNIRICAIQLTVKAKHLNIICTYRAPSKKFYRLLRLLDNSKIFMQIKSGVSHLW